MLILSAYNSDSFLLFSSMQFLWVLYSTGVISNLIQAQHAFCTMHYKMFFIFSLYVNTLKKIIVQLYLSFHQLIFGFYG